MAPLAKESWRMSPCIEYIEKHAINVSPPNPNCNYGGKLQSKLGAGSLA